MDDAPTRDGATTPPHIDSKRRKKLRQKKTALGHAEDDHEDWTMDQHHIKEASAREAEGGL